MSAAANPPVFLSPHSLVDPPPPGRGRARIAKPPPDPGSVREVVACLDGSELGRGVVPHAEAITHALGARLTLLHVLEAEAGGGTPSDALDWGIRQREARAHLDDVTAQLGRLGPDVRTELIQGRAAEQICGWAEQHDIDVTALCSHGARGVTEWDLASTARKLIEHVPGSLLLVPAVAATKAGEVRYRRILIPLDGSPRAEGALPIAVRIAEAQKAEIVLVRVVPDPEVARSGPLDEEGRELGRRVIEHNRRVASDYLDQLRARMSHAGSRVRSLVVANGNVRTTLGHVVQQEGADLVVMSAHGRTGRTDTPSGSVTEHAVAHATTPVLVVRDRARHRSRHAMSRPLERLNPGHATL